MPEPWNSATQVARNLKGIDLDRISIIQVDLPVEALAGKFEATEISLAIRIEVRPKGVIVAHGAQQLGATLEPPEQAGVADEVRDAGGHHDAVVTGCMEGVAEGVVEGSDGRLGL